MTSDTRRQLESCIEAGLKDWDRLEVDNEVLVYATHRDQIDAARRALDRAGELDTQDPELRELISGFSSKIEGQEERVFHGTVLTGVIAIALGGLMLFFGKPDQQLFGAINAAFGVLYFFAAQPRRYVLNRRKMNDTTFTSADLVKEEGGGDDNRLFTGLLTALFISVITPLAFLRNYVFGR